MTEKLKIKLKIVTPERIVLEDEIYQAALPVTYGDVVILPNHRSYIASLKAGEIIIKKQKNAKEEINLAISGGFIEFHQNKLMILADSAERAEEIDIEKAEQARERAEKLKKERISMDETEYARVAASIEKEMAKIKVGKKYRSKHRNS